MHGELAASPNVADAVYCLGLLRTPEAARKHGDFMARLYQALCDLVRVYLGAAAKRVTYVAPVHNKRLHFEASSINPLAKALSRSSRALSYASPA